MQEGKYNIKAVSKMLGIQSGTLRAWERRYQVVAPVRNESGHRLYTEHHVKTLKWLLSKTEQGFTISQAVSLLEQNDVVSEQEQQVGIVNQTQEIANELLQALLEFDEEKAHSIMNQAFSIYTIEKAVIDILEVLLIKIDKMWENKEITTAHEHFATSIIIARISFIMHTFPTNKMLPKVVVVCGPGERHEFGLMIFTLFLKSNGYPTIYLGSSIASDDLLIAADLIKPKAIFLSCTMSDHLTETLAVVDHLKTHYPDLTIGVIGAAIEPEIIEKFQEYRQHVVGQTKSDWDQWLSTQIL
jgi:DNA-binding transcriptional MerR regulator/methylmalonyl-CoA mutase cobalamin-binding subunit